MSIYAINERLSAINEELAENTSASRFSELQMERRSLIAEKERRYDALFRDMRAKAEAVLASA